MPSFLADMTQHASLPCHTRVPIPRHGGCGPDPQCLSHAGTDIAPAIIITSQLHSLIFLGVTYWNVPRRRRLVLEERCFLVEQHCHLMVAEHPYKVCSDAPTPALKVVSPKCSWIEMQRHPSKSASPTPAPSLGPGGFPIRIGVSMAFPDAHQQSHTNPTIVPMPAPALSALSPPVNSHFLKLR